MTILVGVDGSGPSRAALLWALARARSRSMVIALVHVLDDERHQIGTDHAELDADAGQALLDDALSVASELAPQLAVASHLRHGNPARQLASAATDHDLIVVGTHKTGYLQGRSLGAKSIAVASIAPCTVVVVPEETSSVRSGVVVGVAPGEHAHDAVIVGAHEAATRGQDLWLVHASPTRPDESAVENPVEERALLAAAVDRATASVPGIVVRSRLSRRQPADALLDASRRCALLVLGSSRVGPASAGFIGSVTHDVLLNINCTVMVARLPANAEAPLV